MKGIFLIVIAALLIVGLAMLPGNASSHREAPLISQDPMADNTDVYAFRSEKFWTSIVLSSQPITSTPQF